MDKKRLLAAEAEAHDRSLGFLVNDVARLMKTAFDYRGEKLGLTRAQWRLLINLYRSQGMTQSELATILELRVPTVGRLVHRLSEKGWIDIRVDPRDRRNKRLYLSDAVLPVLASVRDHLEILKGDALLGLSEGENTQLMTLLLRVRGNLQRLVDESAPRKPD